MMKRPMRHTSDVANTVWKPTSLNQSQSVKKLASHGTTMSPTKTRAMIPRAIRRTDRGMGGRRAGAGRSNGELIQTRTCHRVQRVATDSGKCQTGGTPSAITENHSPGGKMPRGDKSKYTDKEKR